MKKTITSFAFKPILMALLFVGLSQFKAAAQVPSCNIEGVLEGCATTDPTDTRNDITLTITVAQSGENPTLNYSFVTNGAGASIRSLGDTTYNQFTNRTTQEIIIYPGNLAGGFELKLDVLNNVSGEVNSCSKSFTAFLLTVEADHTLIECPDGVSTLTAIGTSDPSNFAITYTIFPGGESNSDGIFEGLSGSEAGTVYTVEAATAFCTASTEETIFAPAGTPIVLDCPDDVTEDACQTQAAIDAAFEAWLESFGFEGGDNASGSFGETPEAPDACGGSTTVTYTVTGDCEQEESCTKTFTVTDATGLSLVCAGDKEVACGATITFDEPTPEGCGEVTVVPGDVVTVTNEDGTKTHTKSWSATDNCNTEPATCEQVITEAACSDFWGCTPGYWKTHPTVWDQAGDLVSSCIAGSTAGGNGTTSAKVTETFGVTAAEMQAVGLNPNLTLLQAASLGGGGFAKLMRHGVSALLNSCGISDHYPYSADQVIDIIHDAIVNKTAEPFATQFATANEQDPDICPRADGTFTKMDRIILESTKAPVAVQAMQVVVFPNPSSALVNLNMIFNEAKDNVVLEIINVTGQKVAQVYNGSVIANFEYNVEFNASRLPVGTYFYRLNDGNTTQMGKLSIAR